MKKILIVDDQFLIRTAIRSMIKQMSSFAITEADNGDDAVSLCHEEHFDIAFIDIHMPGKDGVEAIREITQSKASLPLLALSGTSNKVRIAEIFEAGADGYLYKDEISVNELRSAMTALENGENYLSPGLFAQEIKSGKNN